MFLHSDYVQLLQKAMQKVEFSKMENIEFERVVDRLPLMTYGLKLSLEA